MDLDDPSVVAAPREVRVPVSLLEQLFRVSAAAATAAPMVRVPVLAIQGLADGVSLPARTRALVARLPSAPAYLEVEAGHDLVTEASPVRDRVLAEVLAFAMEVARGDGTPPPGRSTG
jgi:alpha-beta hydrolase superfamily lysophospholipase